MIAKVTVIAVSVIVALAAIVATPSCGDTRLISIVAYDASIRVDVSVDNTQPIDMPVVDEARMDVQPVDVQPVDVPPVDVPPVDLAPISCPTALVGFAAQTGGTRGGQGGTVVSAATPEALAMYALMDVPLVIQIGTKISLTEQIRVHSNKTIEGVSADAEITGSGFYITGVNNVIVRRLKITKALKTDAIGIDSSHHVWIDHCDLSSDRILPESSETYDGLVDITHASEYVTVSWNLFHDHHRPSIVGHSNSTTAMAEDVGHLLVTYHHNRFTNVSSNTPRVRFGSLHVFNNLYENVDNNAIISQMSANVLVERNAFDTVGVPITTVYADPIQGFARSLDNLCIASCGSDNIQSPSQWMPPYTYFPDDKNSVPAVVAGCAGPKF